MGTTVVSTKAAHADGVADMVDDITNVAVETRKKNLMQSDLIDFFLPL